MKFETPTDDTPTKIDLSRLSPDELVSLASNLIQLKTKLEEMGYKLIVTRQVSSDRMSM